jgi:1-acyl-sn-glycerol-3-phosphate acyltransferase
MTLSRRLASLSLRAAGWRFEGTVPTDRKFVCLATPHTSNWDGVLLLALAASIELPIAWMVKASWVDGPLGPALRRLGAVPIDRSAAHNIVDQMVEEFRRRDSLALVIPPEGTRGRADHWKSGFYYIALRAGVPIVPGFLDFSRKRGGFGPPIHLTGDVGADMDRIRAFYAAMAPTAYAPDNFGPIRLRDEGPTPPDDRPTLEEPRDSR